MTYSCECTSFIDMDNDVKSDDVNSCQDYRYLYTAILFSIHLLWDTVHLIQHSIPFHYIN